MGRNPKRQIIHASYGGQLITDFGRDLRNLMAHEEHLAVFPECSLSQDSKAANRWHTVQGGVYVAAGVGGAITGRGAHFLIIDDPVKGFEDAYSEVQRNKVWNWYKTDARSRLMPKGAIVIVSTRWHEDDLVGRLLAGKGGDASRWKVLHYPAINDAGEALWPQMWPLATMEETREEIGATAWQAVYQGNPTPDTGAFFERDWIKHEGALPPLDQMRYYGASDYAVTHDGGDYTVHLVVGIDPSNRMWIVDLWRKQTKADQWIPPLLAMMDRWKPVAWAEETGQIQQSIGPFLFRAQLEQKVFCRRIQFVSAKDKPTRAQSISARMAMLGLYLPAAAPWAAVVESELLKFPAGVNDDIVDTLSLIGRMMAGLEKGLLPKKDEPPKIRGMQEMTFDELIAEHERDLRRYA